MFSKNVYNKTQTQLDSFPLICSLEQSFFKRWWREQDKETRKRVKKLVKSGQLEFMWVHSVRLILMQSRVSVVHHRGYT